MTSSSLQESSQPVVVKPNNTGLARPKVASPEALKLLGVEPVKTVWGWQQRTILNRLPAEAEGYQVGYDDDQAYVFQDPAPGGDIDDALVVTYDVNDPRTLICGNGVITWQHGQAQAQRLTIDTSTLNGGVGLQTGEYQFGYTLRLDYPSTPSPVPGYTLQRVENDSLGTAALAFDVSNASEYHDDYFAVSDTSAAWWPGETTAAGAYNPGSWYALDFRAKVTCEHFTLVADPDETPSASCAVYQSDDAIIWYKSQEVRPTNGEWNLDVRGSKAARYWRFFFYDGSASIQDFRYTGEAYFPDLRTVGPVTIAEPYLDDLYNEVEGEHYATKYLSPPTADFHFYTELDDSICHGLGEFTLADEEDAPRIYFPKEVEISTEFFVPIIDPTLEVDIFDPLVTDPDQSDIETQNVIVGPGVVGLSADGINFVENPDTPGGLSNKGYTTTTIVDHIYSVDDGSY